MATFRGYGVSVWDIGTTVRWAEACDLVDAAMEDTSTELFAAVSGWKFPMSMPDLLLVTAAFGKNAHKVMPFDPHEEVSAAETSAAHDELMQEIRFTK